LNHYKTQNGHFQSVAKSEEILRCPQQRLGFHYTKSLEQYIQSEVRTGNNFVFNSEHWAGKLFERYSKYLNYFGSFRLTEKYAQLHELWLTSNTSNKTKANRAAYIETFASSPGDGACLAAVLGVSQGRIIFHPHIKGDSREDDDLFYDEESDEHKEIKFLNHPSSSFEQFLHAQDLNNLSFIIGQEHEHLRLKDKKNGTIKHFDEFDKNWPDIRRILVNLFCDSHHTSCYEEQ